MLAPVSDTMSAGDRAAADAELLELRVKRIGYEAETINSYELVAPGGGELPPFSAGSHVDLHLTGGVIRSYSLLNDPAERHRYVVAVNRDADSRGGSRYVHETLRAGEVLSVSKPRNLFPLHEDASHSVLIAGGIGITPLLSMIRRLEALGRSWELFYAARTRNAAAFLDELQVIRPDPHLRVHLDFDDQRDGKLFDVVGIVREAPAQTHFYCCGPLPMLAAFEAATAERPVDHVHVEYFKPKEARALEGGFEVKLARSRKTVEVKPGQTILDALLDAGVAAAYACSEGLCGTCETVVLEGVPDHRDQVLTDEERASNRTIMICCSGAISKTLVLDL